MELAQLEPAERPLTLYEITSRLGMLDSPEERRLGMLPPPIVGIN